MVLAFGVIKKIESFFGGVGIACTESLFQFGDFPGRAFDLQLEADGGGLIFEADKEALSDRNIECAGLLCLFLESKVCPCPDEHCEKDDGSEFS